MTNTKEFYTEIGKSKLNVKEEDMDQQRQI